MNPKYDPPKDMNPWEASTIGHALLSLLHRDMRSYKDFRPDLKEHVEKAIAEGKTDLRSLEEIDAEEVGKFKQLYDLVCKYVPEPLEFSFLMHQFKDTDLSWE